ncbi:FK506-binding protein 1B like [Verticillium longisporum]|nr:FK506-binding protein 1B like [Verticillium longisporum]
MERAAAGGLGTWRTTDMWKRLSHVVRTGTTYGGTPSGSTEIFPSVTRSAVVPKYPACRPFPSSSDRPCLKSSTSSPNTTKTNPIDHHRHQHPRWAPTTRARSSTPPSAAATSSSRSMKVGEKATLDISSDFGYGARGFTGHIPPNADLIFDVELKKVQ